MNRNSAMINFFALTTQKNRIGFTRNNTLDLTLVTIQSNYAVKETIDRIASAVESKGITIFLRIDHSDNAIKQGLSLRPTELIIFGNPKGGTVLMQDKQTAGIDLPVKALAWEDESGKTWLTCNDTKWLADRHDLTENSTTILKAIEDGTALITKATTSQ